MTRGSAHTVGGKAPDGGGGEGRSLPRWLLRHRVTLPDPVEDCLRREALIGRCLPTNRRLTVLRAPGGFGKTTLLAQCCRQEADRGVPVVWLLLDRDDDAAVLDTYLAFAFGAAGVEVTEGPVAGPSRFPRTQRLLAAVESLGTEWVLALDEAEQVTDAGALALLSFLVTRAPPGLHVAIACRELPMALDVAMPVLEGQGEVVTAENLRFSDSETAEFLGGGLSRSELADLDARLAGWPMALRVHRNGGPDAMDDGAQVMGDLVGNWVESRLWRGMGPADRELLLDVGLFTWMDTELLDEVFDETNVMRRLRAMPALAGLLDPVSVDGQRVWRLHPLVREHCDRQQWRERPDRYRWVHRRIARALARRGRTVAAMRHAREAGDAALAGELLLEAGGLLVWLTEGIDRLVAADRHLPASPASLPPRLVLVRSVVLAATGRKGEARRTLASVAVGSAQESGSDQHLRAERVLAWSALGYYGCESTGDAEAMAMLYDADRLATDPALEPTMRAAMDLLICVVCTSHGLFGEARVRAERVEQLMGESFVGLTLGLKRGLVAMAQGRVDEAMSWYGRARDLARDTYLREPDYADMAELLMREVDAERNQDPLRTGAKVALALADVAHADLSVRFAACDLIVDAARGGGMVDLALVRVEEMRSAARRRELPALGRHLDAWRVSLLADAGRADAARRSFESAALPDSDAGCLDPMAQSWREIESVACARMRLLRVESDLGAARELGKALVEAVAGSGIRRTEMRALALLARNEHEAGRHAAAHAHLTRFLDLYGESDYSYGLVREGKTAEEMLERFVEEAVDDGRREAAVQLLAAVSRGQGKPAAGLTAREMEVLSRLDTRDRDIARALGLSHDGVRYHVRNIFSKLRTRSRREAVERARGLGLLPAE